MGLAEAIDTKLRRHRVPATLLEIEITESAATKDLGLAVKSVRALRDLGIKVSVDDFGTGYSNLGQLQRLALTAIKIDRSLVASLPDCPRAAAIVHATVNLAHRLGLKVVAEGVETRAQLGALRSIQCDEAQGFLFCKPLSAERFLAWARTHRSGDRILTHPVRERAL